MRRLQLIASSTDFLDLRNRHRCMCMYIYVYASRNVRLTANCLIHRISGFPKSALAYVYVYTHICISAPNMYARLTTHYLVHKTLDFRNGGVCVYTYIYIYVVHAKCARDLQYIATSTEFLNFLESTQVIIYVNMHIYLNICCATKHTCVYIYVHARLTTHCLIHAAVRMARVAHIYTYIYIIHTCIYTYIYIYICLFIYMCKYLSLYIYMYICIYVYI